MRISDWSSDVCSSDLPEDRLGHDRVVAVGDGAGVHGLTHQASRVLERDALTLADAGREAGLGAGELDEHVELPVLGTPLHRAPDAELHAEEGVGLVTHGVLLGPAQPALTGAEDRKSTRLNSNH